jgi:hypothetical protein
VLASSGLISGRTSNNVHLAAPDGVVVEVVQMAEHPRSGAPSTSAEP